MYRTVKDECLLNIYAKYSKYLSTMTDDEINSLFQQELKKFNLDFETFYKKQAKISARLSFDSVVPYTILEASNVLGICCLYRSIEDIWDFYDPNVDVYEDGFLRVWQDENGIHVIDILSTNRQMKVVKP